jgi:two-component system response regulator CpxR
MHVPAGAFAEVRVHVEPCSAGCFANTASTTANQDSRTTGTETDSKMRPRKTILCVEDNEQILSVRKFLLETRGYRVLAFANASEALEVLQAAIPGSVDLLLSDLILPQMDGNELIRRAKQIHPCLPSLLISGTVSNFDRAAAADAFLPKGACTPAEMLDRIRILVARKRGPKKHVAAAPVMAAVLQAAS